METNVSDKEKDDLIAELHQRLAFAYEVQEVNSRKFDEVSNNLRISLRSLEVMSDQAERLADENDILKANVEKLKQELAQYPTPSETEAIARMQGRT